MDTVRGHEMTGWFGLLAPRKTPDEIIAKPNAKTIRSLKSPEMQQKLHALGAVPIGNTPRQFAAYLSAETDKARKTIKISRHAS
jgi:tripartite-type tricarboxylate transporter receptor subunit TctC